MLSSIKLLPDWFPDPVSSLFLNVGCNCIPSPLSDLSSYPRTGHEIYFGRIIERAPLHIKKTNKQTQTNESGYRWKLMSECSYRSDCNSSNPTWPFTGSVNVLIFHVLLLSHMQKLEKQSFYVKSKDDPNIATGLSWSRSLNQWNTVRIKRKHELFSRDIVT